MEAQGPHSYILRMGGGGVRVIFLGLKFWPKEIFFGSMKDVSIFLGRKKNQRDFFGLQKKDMGIFLGMLKNIVILLGRQVLKL